MHDNCNGSERKAHQMGGSATYLLAQLLSSPESRASTVDPFYFTNCTLHVHAKSVSTWDKVKIMPYRRDRECMNWFSSHRQLNYIFSSRTECDDCPKPCDLQVGSDQVSSGPTNWADSSPRIKCSSWMSISSTASVGRLSYEIDRTVEGKETFAFLHVQCPKAPKSGRDSFSQY